MMNSVARKRLGKRQERGYTLIEVLIGILIFALGMMALAQLQGNLARSSSDANARTVAVNLAEEVIEAARTFVQITSDGTNPAYNDIVDGQRRVTRGGTIYTVATDVTDYFYNPATGVFSTSAPTGAARSDFKLVELTVAWNNAQEFQIDQNSQTEGRLGSGSIRISDVISSITSPSGGKVILSSTGDTSYAPPVDYNPGENPDIISIQLGQNKFKESTTPLPDVIRQDELVETKFDVVTYSQDDSGATFLRREEFRAISCECTLRTPDQDGEGGLRPTVWDGFEYSEPEFVSKPYGESANNQQSDFCTLCCRDHHDGGSGENDLQSDPGRSQYNPFRSNTAYYDSEYPALQGDHKHYSRDSRTGELTLATSDGDAYVEACRMVRKDGFFRIAQDLRQEGLNAFPGDFLDETVEVGIYSKYVTEAVSAYEEAIGATNGYESAPPQLTRPPDMDPVVEFPASTFELATNLPTPTGETTQQLRSRGIYVDYMSDDLRTKINCLDLGGTGETCDAPGVTTALEIIPFYDVQLTWLSRWNESPNNNPVDVSNEAVKDNNLHSRGIASLESGFGYSTVSSRVHRGNLGLTATDPVDPQYLVDEKLYNLYALAVDYSSPPPLSGAVVSGSITSGVGGVKAADVEISAKGAQCDRTNLGFECVIESGVSNATLTVTNYQKSNKALLACSLVLERIGGEQISLGAAANKSTFRLPATATSFADILIKENNC